MHNISFKISLIFLSVFFTLSVLHAQTESKYDYKEAFATDFYKNNGTIYRSASGKPGPEYWQNYANYTIKARLDTVNNEIIGSLEMEYINNSTDEMDFIWLHLDQNLFNPKSIWYASVPLEESRYGYYSSDFEGGFVLEKITVEKNKNVEYGIYDTRMRRELPRTLKAKGDKIELSIDYRYKIPEYGADRTGILETEYGSIYAIAQWYPRISVYDDIDGWDTHPYTGPGEFYLEFGNYHVEITAPSDHIVVAGAELLNPEEVWTSEQLQRLEKAKNSDETVVIRSEVE